MFTLPQIDGGADARTVWRAQSPNINKRAATTHRTGVAAWRLDAGIDDKARENPYVVCRSPASKRLHTEPL
jgi:hypothetical protein